MAGIDSYTTLCIQSETTDGSTTFTDSSPVGRTISRAGTTHSTTQAVFGSSSIYFNGASYLSPDGDNWAFGSANFTIDFRVRFNAVSSFQNLFRQGYVNIYINNSGQIVFKEEYTYWTITGETTLSANTWYHIAVVRNGTTFTLYINGISDGTITEGGSLGTPATTYAIIGMEQGLSSYLTGYMEEIRVDKGIARWTENFTSPTAPFDNIDSMEMIGDGGAIAGGEGEVAGQYAIIASGGAISGGSVDFESFYVSPPTQHWTFDNIIGSTVQNEISGGATLSFTGRTQVEGKFGLSLSGGLPPTYPLYTSANVAFKSVSMWIKRYDMINHAYLLCNFEGAQFLFANYSPSYGYAIGFWNGTEVIYTNLAIDDTEWHHVCLIEGASDDSHWVYLDNIKASAEVQTNLGGLFKYLSFYSYSEYSFRNHLIDNVQVYDRIITDEDIAYLYSASSDAMALPRLPSISPVSTGGAVVGGEAALDYHNVTTIFYIGGGAIAGGGAILNFANIVASYGDYIGAVLLGIATTANIDSSYGSYLCHIDTAGHIAANYGNYLCEASTMHGINCDVDCSYGDYTGSSHLSVSKRTRIEATYGDYSGAVQVSVALPALLAANYGSYTGAIATAPKRSVSIAANYGEYFGYSLVAAGEEQDYILHFAERTLASLHEDDETNYGAYLCDIQVNSGAADTILAYSRAR